MLLLYPWPRSNFNSPRIEFIVNDKSKKRKGGGSGFMDYFLLFVLPEINKLAACATTIFPYVFFLFSLWTAQLHAIASESASILVE